MRCANHVSSYRLRFGMVDTGSFTDGGAFEVWVEGRYLQKYPRGVLDGFGYTGGEKSDRWVVVGNTGASGGWCPL